ncbi:hypothetical protein SDC9_95605 [bioreactor metagenome]|uniref:Uncharacterized protein n=1 Tax=bioreactor metagenome TaxID=1076179 RepID=A0A645A853_9ZZZZ
MSTKVYGGSIACLQLIGVILISCGVVAFRDGNTDGVIAGVYIFKTDRNAVASSGGSFGKITGFAGHTHFAARQRSFLSIHHGISIGIQEQEYTDGSFADYRHGSGQGRGGCGRRSGSYDSSGDGAEQQFAANGKGTAIIQV